MVDLSDQQLSKSEEMSSKYPEVGSEESQGKKTCADCGTSNTPLWRGGSAGPKSLCNACGIRSRKKRKSILGTNTKSEEKKASKKTNHSSNNGSKNQKFVSFGKEILMQRSRMVNHWSKLGEEEQAAVLLMALSYASVYDE